MPAVPHDKPSVRPSQNETWLRARHPGVPRHRARAGAQRGVRTRSSMAERRGYSLRASASWPYARGQHIRGRYESARGAAAEQRSPQGRCEAHAQRRADDGRRAGRAVWGLVGYPLLELSHSRRSSSRLHRPRGMGNCSGSVTDTRRRDRHCRDDVREVVRSVPESSAATISGPRGPADYVFMDPACLARRADAARRAHATSHVVKDRLMRRFPHLADVVIHIEPPPPQ